jgi:hypothetical protein
MQQHVAIADFVAFSSMINNQQHIAIADSVAFSSNELSALMQAGPSAIVAGNRGSSDLMYQ